MTTWDPKDEPEDPKKKAGCGGTGGHMGSDETCDLWASQLAKAGEIVFLDVDVVFDTW